MTNASRAPVDIESLARDLRQDEARGRAAKGEFDGAHRGDPLAELARIVGQDDPFRQLLAARGDGRIEPRFAPETPARATPADAFDQYLASVEQDAHAGHDDPDHGAATAPEADGYDEGRALRRSAPRRRLVSVGAGLAVVAVAITGALTYKGLKGGSSGGVPVIQADTTPLKVAPKVADGVEIPDQNRQIYDRKPAANKDGQIRIVNREEQPLDVSEAARAAQGKATSGATSGMAGTTPGSDPFGAFGEPRRVRTVAVRPEGPPAREAPTEAAASPIPTMVLPGDQASPKPARGVRQVAAAAQLPQSVTTQAAATQVAPVQDSPAVAAVQAPKPVAVKPPLKATQRVAAVAPDAASIAQDAPATTAATTSADAAVSDGPSGGFAVQLGVRNSASDAKAAFRQMQAKYSQLAGKPELIRQAEVNGKTLYRVRVGPLAKAEAASLCTALQGAGGQCFVAKN